MLLLGLTPSAHAAILIIAHSSAPVDSISRKEIKNIYLGSPSNTFDTPLMLSTPNDVRQTFNAKVIGLSEARLQSYIAQMRFGGRALPLEEIDNIEDMLNYVRENPGSLGYVPENTELPDELKVIFQL